MDAKGTSDKTIARIEHATRRALPLAQDSPPGAGRARTAASEGGITIEDYAERLIKGVS